jgi:Zn-finger nucleic acid-binding protein
LDEHFGLKPKAKSGRDVDGVAKHDADHFMKCPSCGQWFDMRDLDQVIEHVHAPAPSPTSAIHLRRIGGVG